MITSNKIAAQNGIVKGNVIDKKTGEALIGAGVTIESLKRAVATDYEGGYSLSNLPTGVYVLKVSSVAYKTTELTEVEVTDGQTSTVNIALEEEAAVLGAAVVTSARRMNSEVSMIQAQKASLTVVSGVSSQQIARTQDRDASEVIKRIPGISIMDDKFVVSRGLSQRYNNVWVNNAAVPSSESDTRSFSFDIIPSSQIENVIIVKSPTPELPADFSGGFIKIETKNMPVENSLALSYGLNINTSAQFHDFLYAKGSSTDFLGFDNGFRSMKGVPYRLINENPVIVEKFTKTGFNNDWEINIKKPIPDQRFSAALNRRFKLGGGRKLGLIAAVNYGYSSRTQADMKNARFGVYDAVRDEAVYLYKYTDNAYYVDAKLGGLLNVSFIPNDKNKFELRNIFNQLGRDKYTFRSGYQYISGYYDQEKHEYMYSSRMSYSGQMSGKHTFNQSDKIDWTLGFSYANKNQPDRRIIDREENNFVGDRHYGQMRITQNDVFRDFITLKEFIYSATGNYERELSFGNFKPLLKTGLYGEYRTRKYRNRAFYYRWKEGSFDSNFPYRPVIDSILTVENFGADKLYLYEDTDNRNSYSGSNALGAAYFALNFPMGKFNLYAGLRFEYNLMTLKSYTSIKEYGTKELLYPYADFFPSLNATYNFNRKHLLRAAFGVSINRQEFREVSPSVYYDFDLFSSVMGNPKLNRAKIQNFDLRYEFYPSSAEMISVAVFYKHFINPIEWTYLDAGGSYTFTFDNAARANNLGLEIDVKKSLDFVGMNNFSVLFNGSIIKSKVMFTEGSMEHDRPMQGQSPYIINAGLFYQSSKAGLSLAAMYNVIGKRIIGIGKVDSSEGSTINSDVPDMYEIPRNVIDLSISKKFGKRLELNMSIRDLLADKSIFKQFPKFYDEAGRLHSREQTTREFKPGRNISLTIKVNL
ncbi:MAG: outer membrane beta-barrel protein [Prevotellaceae bacterium]|nr:outer membrane beta-barrel protein [Prevotellaceae bacterium]